MEVGVDCSTVATTPGPPDRFEFLGILTIGAAVIIFGHASAEVITAAAAALGSVLTLRSRSTQRDS